MIFLVRGWTITRAMFGDASFVQNHWGEATFDGVFVSGQVFRS